MVDLVGGAVLGAAFGELLKAVLEIKDKASNFENTLACLSTTLTAIDPVIKEIEQLNNELGRPKEELQSLIKEIEEGKKLVHKFSKINELNFPARMRYQVELATLGASLEKFTQAQATIDSKETLPEVRRELGADNKLPLVRTEDAAEDAAAQVLEDITSLGKKVSQAEAKVLKGPHEDSENNLEAIEKLRSSIQFLCSEMDFKSSDGTVYQANNLLVKAISKLEDEFKQLLSFYSIPVEPECLFDCLPNSMLPSSGSTGHEGDPSGKNPSSNLHSEPHDSNNADAVVYTPPALIPSRILPLLHDLAQQMVEAGHQQQLLKIYRDARSNLLEEILQIFGVEKLNKDDVQELQQEILEAKVGNWIHLMRIAVKLLFAGERKVCDRIFEGFDSLSEQCFAEVTTNSVCMLLSFGEAIAESKRSLPERLFLILDMHELMRELHSEIETLFKANACTEIRGAAIRLTKLLAKTAQETFGEFKEVVEKDATETAVTDGSVHPLTSYVIDYVKLLSDYRSTLKQLFQEFEGGDDSSQLASVTMRIMQALQANLDGKSKQYRDPALTHLFLMNNIDYIVRSVRTSEAKDLLGDDWVRLNSEIVQQHANQYITNAWAKTLQCLSDQGPVSSIDCTLGVLRFASGVSGAILEDRFKVFNDMFEELHRKQSQWTVPDTRLRKSLYLAVAQILLPAYRSFVGRYGYLMDGQKNSRKYIKYTPEDLDRMLGEFFEGKNMNETK